MHEDEIIELPAVQELQTELGKTAVITDTFKNYLIGMAMLIADQASSGRNPEAEALHGEFVARRFSDETAVKTTARTMEELCEKIQSDGQVRGLVVFLRKHFHNGDPLCKILIGSFDDVVAVREWFWMMINKNPDEFAKTVGLGEWAL